MASTDDTDPRAYASAFNSSPMPSIINNALDSPSGELYRLKQAKEARFLRDATNPPKHVDTIPIVQSLGEPSTPVKAAAEKAPSTITVDDQHIQVKVGCNIPIPNTEKSFSFAVGFTARKVDVDADSISIFMNDILSFTIPRMNVVLDLTINDSTYKVVYAASMKISPYKVMSFIVVE